MNLHQNDTLKTNHLFSDIHYLNPVQHFNVFEQVSCTWQIISHSFARFEEDIQIKTNQNSANLVNSLIPDLFEYQLGNSHKY